ncbi:MAG: hypothetical protein IPO81_09580 [Kouleothrix sp.]|nr:hypothetical protein [Kouleothrix sp.]
MTRLINADGRDVTSQTLDAIWKVHGQGDITKAATVTTATGLTAYDLEAPAKNLYPVLTPLRNRIPRITKSSGAGTAANWKEVTGISGNSAIPAMPWVPEGQRAGRMSVSTADRAASYVTLGLETDVSFESQSAGAGFEDARASAGMRLLQQTMILEEYTLLGGNRDVALGTPVPPTVSNAGTGGTIANASYNVYVVALTSEGALMATVAGGVKRQVNVTGQDQKTFNLNGGSSKVSAAGTTTTSGTTSTISAYTTPIKGALAYAWYVGTSGAEKLEAITNVSHVKFTTLAGTGAAFSAIADGSTDRSANATLAYNGLLYAAFNSSLAYYAALANGTPGTGTPLTASGRGSVTEIDTMLKAFWDNYRLSPEELYVNSQELMNITTKVLTGASSAPLVRFNLDANQKDPSFVAGQVVGFYFNPFSLNGNQIIPIRLHPTLPAGTIFAWAQNLPAQYESANVPQVAQVQCRRDYYQIDWAPITRSNETGVYCESVLKVYAPFALGVITNIANG